jgi:hypothetical protein
MLPFGLLAEVPLAKAFKNIILDNDQDASNVLYESYVHGWKISPFLLQEFLQEQVRGDDHEFGVSVLEAATLLVVDQVNLQCVAHSPTDPHLEL